MKSRLLGFIMVLGAGIVSLLLAAPSASAKSEIYGFTTSYQNGSTPTIIQGTYGSYTGPAEFFMDAGSTTRFYTFNVQAPDKGSWGCGFLEISFVKSVGSGVFEGQIQNLSGECPLDQKITIYDPYNLMGTGKADLPPPPVAPTVDVKPDCDAGAHFNWLICDGLRTLVGVVDWVRDEIIVPFLKEAPLSTKDPAFKIWSSFRNVASVFFILVFFLVIFGTAIGWDNYAVKKTLPRLVMGAVLVPFSWYICAVVLDTGNILGQGILTLTASIIPAANVDFTSSFSKLVLGGTLIAATAAVTAALAVVGFGLVASMALALAGVFFTLVLRKILIVLLICLSPFAFLAWILPNTTKWFDEWWTNFFKLVMMYPLIMLLFEAGRLFAATAGVTAANGLEKGILPLFQILGLIIPLFAVPFAFKWAGSGLELGRKGIGKGIGALDKKFGKDSERAKEASTRRRDNNARRALDTANNRFGGKRLGFESKKLAAVRRGIANKRSGLGGFAGNSSIPLLRNNAAQQARLNSTAAKAENDLAQSAATDNLRKAGPQSSKERITNKTNAEYEKQLSARVAAAGAATKNKNNVALRNLDASSGDRDSATRVEAARASGDQQKLLEALRDSTGGLDNMEAIVMGEVMKGGQADRAVVEAALNRLAVSPGGTQRAQQMALGSYVKYTDDDGKVRFAGGNGQNAVETTDAQGNKSYKFTGQALLGGNYDRMVDDKWLGTYTRGMKGSSSADTKKTMAQAAVDMSAKELSGMTLYDIERRLAYYDQAREGSGYSTTAKKAAIKGAKDFAVAADSLARNPQYSNSTSADTLAAIAEAGDMRNPVISGETQDYFRSQVTAPPPEPTIAPVVAGHIVAATDNDIVHASQITAQISGERAAGGGVSSTETRLQDIIADKGRLEADDLAAAGVAAKSALAAGEAAPQAALGRKMAQQFGANLDHLHEVERRFAVDDKYRASVQDAYLRGKKIPDPPL